MNKDEKDAKGIALAAHSKAKVLPVRRRWAKGRHQVRWWWSPDEGWRRSVESSSEQKGGSTGAPDVETGRVQQGFKPGVFGIWRSGRTLPDSRCSQGRDLKHMGVFRRTDAEPLRVVLNPDAAKEPARSKPRSLPTEVMDSLEQMQLLVEADMIRPNRKSTHLSTVMAAPKQLENRMAAENRVANVQLELVPWPVPDLEAMVSLFDGVPASFLLVAKFLQSSWQMTRAEDALDSYSASQQSRPCTPTRVSRRMLDATAFSSRSSRRK